MGLLFRRKKLMQRTKIVILLQSHGPTMPQVVGNPGCGDKVKILDAAVVRGIDNRIDDDVHRV